MKKLLLLSGLIATAFFTGLAFGAESAPAATPPQPTLEQRVGGLEAYVGNTDPSAAVAALKDKDGNLPKGFTMSTLGAPGPGHNAWQMTSAALVLFMTLPGLALFYGGLVRRKNVLSVMAQCLGCAGLVTVLWWACGYSLVFGKNLDGTFWGKIFGGTEYFFLKGVDSLPNTDYSYWVSQNVFSMYQLM